MRFMYESISAFLDDWKQECNATSKIMHALTDESLCRTVSPEGRSLGTLAWHVVLTLGEMGGKAGLSVESPAEDAPKPTSSSEIASQYEKVARSVAERIQEKWNDSMLGDTLQLYGSTWTRAGVLASLVKHQIHHRGQMTVLMRQAGLRVPGVYGPAREEWAAMGMPPMK
jgi:uncharacterized damage-inducible protein DinB